MKSQNEQSAEPVKKKEPVKKITEMTLEEQLNEFRPKTDEDFQMILYRWLRRFHKRHLAGLEDKLNQDQKDLFIVKWKDTREKLGADLEGGMTNSLLNASKILQGDSYVE